MGEVTRHVRSQREVIQSMLASTAWDHRSRQQKMYILGRAKKLDLDIYQLRAVGWHCTAETAKQKLQDWLLQ